MATTGKPLCVSLKRVSKTHDEDMDLSLKAQAALLVAYNERLGFTEAKPFTVTEGASKKWQRKKFNEMMDFVRKNNIKLIVVEKVDRLTRNYRDMLMIDSWLDEDPDRQVHFVKDSIVLHRASKSQEKLNWGIRVLIAKNQIDNLIEEVDKGIKQKLEGGWLPGTPPPGYKNIGKIGERIQVVDGVMALIMQKVFELYLEPAQSVTSLTRAAAQIGLASKNGRPLGRSHLHKMLSNRYYIGELWWDGKFYGVGKHDPIISKEVFDAVQHKLNQKNIPKHRKHNTLFKGLITCEECGSLITWELHKGTYYGRCKGYRTCSRKKYSKQTEIEQQLFERFEGLLAPSPDLAQWIKEAIQLRHETDMAAYYASISSLKRRHTDLARFIDIAYDDRAVGRISAEKYDAKVAEWQSEQAAILDKLSKFDDTYHARLAHNLNILELSQRATEIYEAKSNVEDRRALLGQLFSNLTLDGPVLSVKYTEIVEFIAEKAERSRRLKNTFEQAEHGSMNQKDALLDANKNLWLGR